MKKGKQSDWRFSSLISNSNSIKFNNLKFFKIIRFKKVERKQNLWIFGMGNWNEKKKKRKKNAFTSATIDSKILTSKHNWFLQDHIEWNRSFRSMSIGSKSNKKFVSFAKLLHSNDYDSMGSFFFSFTFLLRYGLKGDAQTEIVILFSFSLSRSILWILSMIFNEKTMK